MKSFDLKDLLEAGVHYGHQTQRWNPKMKPFVYKEKGGIHIIHLGKSMVLFRKALDKVRATAAEGGSMIFVGTKKQAVEPLRKAAQKCQQFYITKRWLGGTLTNFVTIKSSVDRLKKIDQMREKGEIDYYSKKEKAKIEKEYQQLAEYLDGIREMKEIPDLMFVVDLVKEHISVSEAKKLRIPVIGVADTNSNPDGIDFLIPGNDDSIRSITFFCERVAEAYVEGAAKRQERLRLEGEEEVEEREGKAKEEAPKGAEEEEPEEKGLENKIASGKRTLVAAGLAEDVEIEMELNKELTAANDIKKGEEGVVEAGEVVEAKEEEADKGREKQ